MKIIKIRYLRLRIRKTKYLMVTSPKLFRTL